MNSVAELNALREKYKGSLSLRPISKGGTRDDNIKREILICGGTGCTSSHSTDIIDAFNEEIKKAGVTDTKVVRTGCFGLCELGPIVIVYPEGAFYSKVKVEHVKRIVDEHIVGGNVVKELLYPETIQDDGSIIGIFDTHFYENQCRIALKNCGNIDPENINEYIANDGYAALAKVLTEMTPDEVIEEVKASGLRGRGGAGFPTGVKWGSIKRDDQEKFILCNADEGDPGAFMDCSVLEGDPHVILEAMAIGGYAIGAHQGYIYVRAEYPIAVHRLTIAINQAREYGLLGKNILGTGFDFDVGLRLGAGAFVCGEGTALEASIEGKRGEPRPKPPRMTEKGLFGKPSVLNNVETYANIPQIIMKGAKWFTSIGTEKSPGTKVFCLVGNIKHTGLVEIPMGTTLREIVEDIGGGIPNGKKFKAAQTGGPSGGCIPESLIDTPMDFDNLSKIGTMMGSGGLIVMDEDTCMVDIAKFYLGFTVDESCGKCTPCRIGTKRLLEMLTKVTRGEGTLEMLDEITELCHFIKDNSLCGLGQAAPNPVLSTITHFRDEYVSHVVDKKCPAGVCKALMSYNIDPTKCRGCTLCARNCPAGAVTGKIKEPHVIDPNKCIKCGVCYNNCRFGAIYKA